MGLVTVETDAKVYLVVVARPETLEEFLDDLIGADCWVHRAFANEKDAVKVADSWNQKWSTSTARAAVMTVNLCELAQ